jgi:hypothetical protein
MAKPTEEAKNLPEVKADVTNMLPSVIDFTADSGSGFEEADSSSYAIPFLRMLQSISPAAKKKDPAYIDGAEEGDMINTVTEKLYKGDEGVIVIPCHYIHKYNLWAQNRGGFRGSLTVADYADMNKQRITIQSSNGPVEAEADMDGNIITDSREHYVLIVHPDGSYVEALLSLGGTQLKKSKKWMTMMRGLRKNGKEVPMFSQMYKITPMAESNDKGSWSGYKIDHIGEVQYAELYEAAKKFYLAVRGGTVKVATDSEDLPY